MKYIPIAERELCGGVQKIYRFSNNYGASVIQHQFSYGSEEGLWELAVVQFEGDGEYDFKLNYSTPITNDVIGWLTEDGVESLLEEIENLHWFKIRG